MRPLTLEKHLAILVKTVSKLGLKVLAKPLCPILNSSFNEQQLPALWEAADIVQIIKSKLVTEICERLQQCPSLRPFLK